MAHIQSSFKTGAAQKIRIKAARVNKRSTRGTAREGEMTVKTQLDHNFRLPSGAEAGLRTVFHVSESDGEIEARIAASCQPLQRCLGIPAEPNVSFYKEVIDVPIRPAWERKSNKAKINSEENLYFEAYLKTIYAKYPPTRLNHFEHNLEVWRQLWRVCEFSDILLLSADARHPLFHIPPSLYRFVTHTLNKPMVLILNKIDLVSQQHIVQWKAYIAKRFPKLSVVPFSSFPRTGTVTHEPAIRTKADEGDKGGGQSGKARQRKGKKKKKKHQRDSGILRRRDKNLHLNPFGTDHLRQLLSALADKKYLKQKQTDNTSEAASPVHDEADDDDDDDDDDEAHEDADAVPADPQDPKGTNDQSAAAAERIHRVAVDGGDDDDLDPETMARLTVEKPLFEDRIRTGKKGRKKQRKIDRARDQAEQRAEEEKKASKTPAAGIDGEDDVANAKARQEKAVLTVGFIGHPNAGKSSLINALLGRPAAHVSATPGHTKHLQTLRLVTDERVELLDCPGLVFPAVDMPKPLQILCGLVHLPHIREPFSAVAYLAERVPLETLYQLKPVLASDSESVTMLEDSIFDAKASREMALREYRWSAYSLCEALARQKGFKIKGSARLDVQRAARTFLQDVLDGVLTMPFGPPTD